MSYKDYSYQRKSLSENSPLCLIKHRVMKMHSAMEVEIHEVFILPLSVHKRPVLFPGRDS